MPWIIKKVMCGDTEMLPDLVDTPLWKAVTPEYCSNPTKRDIRIAGLYEALSERENYFQENTPTAFGNPEYNLYVGMVRGYMQALELDETTEGERIIIRKNGKAILIVDKVKKPSGYYQSVLENRKLRKDFGI